MNHVIWLIWAAGAVQVGILAANFVLPGLLDCRGNLARVSPMIREIFIVHWIYVGGVLVMFAALSLGFAPELVGASRLGRFLSAAMALFWLPRIPLQLFFYDAEFRRGHRLGDVAMISALAFLVAAYGAAALGVRL
jgi:hypothetical protein